MVQVLLEDVKKNHAEYLDELYSLANVLKSFEFIVYKPDFLENWCKDPAESSEAHEILLRAFRRDQKDPFVEHFHVHWLQLDTYDPTLPTIKSLVQLQNIPRYMEIVECVKIGAIQYRTPKYNYRSLVKSHLRKAFTEKIVQLFTAKFTEQTGRSSQSVYSFAWGYDIFPKNIGFIDSYLTMPMARRILIQLPFIKFVPKTSSSNINRR